MQAERWKRIEELCQAALEQPPETRAAFLERACPDDAKLRAEVQALLNAQADSFLESAPISAIKGLGAGAKLGNFEIVELLGRGGMGEVWRARDARLKREVAIKVLPAALARDPDRIARFEREARAASALNHPNIVSVHDIGCDNGTYWIATELVRGDTLRRMIEAGPMPAPKAVDIATQVANGLAAAHAAGLVHRDLKPDNIMVTRDGHVKILDFGLAKQRRTAQDSTTTDLTDEGVVLGTAGYMSPEQVRGEVVDHRSDLFSFGVVMYEMLCGKRAFAGDSSVEVMNAILKDEPPALPASVPSALARIVQRCLEKERERRFQSAADLGFALQALSLSPAPAERPKRRAWWKWAALLAAASVAVAALYWLSRPLPPPRVTGMVRIAQDSRLIDWTFCPLLSDGSRLFYATSDDVPAYQVSVNGGDPVPLPLQTKAAVCLMDISRDRTEFLVCRIVKFPKCEVWAEPVASGSARRLGSIVSRLFAAWSPDGQQVVYAQDRELHLASRDGTEIRKLATLGGDLSYLRWSPDGRRIRVSVEGVARSPMRLWEVQADGTGLRQVLPGWNPSWSTSNGIWTADGRYFVFLSNQKIWVVREKAGFLQRGGREPVQLDIGLLAPDFPLPSEDGKRLFFEGSEARNEFLRYDPKSSRFSLELPGISGTQLEFSRDGKWVAYVSVPEGSLFRAAADGSQRVQLTWPPLHTALPRWSPDGKQIAFDASLPGKQTRVHIVPADGGSPQQVTNGEAGEHGDHDPSWSPDGASIAFGAVASNKPASTRSPLARADTSIHVVDVKTHRVSTLLGSQGMWSPRWSPVGHVIAGLSSFDERGLVLYDLRNQTQTELYSQGCDWPSWSSDGEFLYFLKGPVWWRVRIRDRKAEPVGFPKDFTPANWDWFVAGPNGSLITARSVGTGGIYTLDWELP
jgi:eukaryotic-like serine/threonine-protein kinase